MGKTYGYALSNTAADSINQQLEDLKRQGISPGNLFSDRLALNPDREGYRKLLSLLRKGDLLIVCRIDSLGSDFSEIQFEWQRITKVIGADILVLDMGLLDTRKNIVDADTSISEIVLQVMTYLTETKKQNAKQRQAEGIASAKAQGVRLGRPPKRRPRSYGAIKEAYLAKQITKADAAKRLKVSARTLDRWLKDDEASAPQCTDIRQQPREDG